MLSPLTGLESEALWSIPRARVAELYETKHGVDVDAFLKDVEAVTCYRCAQTGFEFFGPETLAGPPEFYAALYKDTDQSTWAYQTDKWEYQAAARFVPAGAKVLDIGCGGGDFLHYLGSDYDRTGLETNSYGVALCRDKGLHVVDTPLEELGTEWADTFDTVISLQVLEHVPDPLTFLKAAIHVLVPGGTLVIAVPNNGGFVGQDHMLPLNMPPHHMGRWKQESLSAVADLLSLELLGLEFEPLAQGNIGWYQSWFEDRYVPKSRIARSLWYRLGFAAQFTAYLESQRSAIHGHSILAAYRKPDTAKT